MDSAPIHRLRVSRSTNSSGFIPSGSPDTPGAGPSRPSASPDILRRNDEDAQATPKLSGNADLSADEATHYGQAPLSDSALRLRALLARTNTSNSRYATQANIGAGSERETGLDSHSKGSHSTSFAQQSLRKVFDRATRDSPEKQRPRRRNSIDFSEVESSPKAQRERARSKMQRRSLSDEDIVSLDKSSLSVRSSQAEKYDLLRARLTKSQGPPSLSETDQMSETETPVRKPVPLEGGFLESSSAQLFATSTPHSSLNMPSQLQFESNLLEQDSDMHRALGGVSSYSDFSVPDNGRPASFPPFRKSDSHTPRPTLLPRASPQSGRSSINPRRRNDSASSMSSSRSSTSTHDVHQREREWNKPHPKPHPTPDLRHRHSHTESNARSRASSPTISRQGSAASLEESASTATTRPSRSLSSLGNRSSVSPSQSRTRTLSHPTKPTTPSSLVPGPRPLSRHHSHSPSVSVSNSSRTSSPNGSMHSQHSSQDENQEEIHDRERNWNAHHPVWHRHEHGLGLHSMSPAASSTPRSYRSVTNASAAQPSSLSHTSLPRPSPRPKLVQSPASQPRTRDETVRPYANGNGHTSSGKSPATGRNGWTFPRGDKPDVPALDLDRSSPEPSSQVSQDKVLSSPTPGSRPSSRTSGSVKPSHIPVRATTAKSPRAHRRSTTELHTPTSVISPRVPIEVVLSTAEAERNDDIIHASDLDSATPEGTPLAQAGSSLPDADDALVAQSPPANHSALRDEDRLRRATPLTSMQALSPPPTPPTEHPPRSSANGLLLTPTRRASFNSVRQEFHTPSPPKGLPTLPDMPSSDETTEDEAPYTPNGNITEMKTPRPPGAWSVTPQTHHVDNEAADENDDLYTNAYRRNLSLIKTPHAPGAWNNHTPEQPRTLASDTLEVDRSPGGLATPEPSLSRGHSLAPNTQPPPGGCTASQMSSAKRRSILKVRFDVENAELAKAAVNLPDEGSALDEEPQSSKLQHDRWTTSLNGHDDGDRNPFDPPSDPPRASTSQSGQAASPSRQKSPTVRVVDAYGKVIAPYAKQTPEPQRVNTTITVVDSMGRPSDDSFAQDGASAEGDIPLTRMEALSQVRNTLSDLVAGFETDTSRDDTAGEEELRGLRNASLNSREAQAKLANALENMQKNGVGDYSAAEKLLQIVRSGHFEQKKPPIISLNRQRVTTFKVVSVFIVTQCLLALIMHWLSMRRAHHLFLTTYYDPMNAELHLYTQKPDTLRYTMMYDSGNTSTDAVAGWQATVRGAWHYLAVVLYEWQLWIWETWGDHDTQRSLVSWPPS